MVLDGIGVMLVRPDKLASIATFITAINAGTTANRGGYVNPRTTPTSIYYFYLEFENKAKSLRYDYTRTIMPNGKVNAIPLRKYDRSIVFNNAFVGSYNKDTYAEYFEQGLEYATIEWPKITGKWVYVIRLDDTTNWDGDQIWSVKEQDFIPFQGIVDGYTTQEDSNNNLFIKNMQISWGE